jgi:selenide,water dikinase
MNDSTIRLTAYSHGSGCGCKIAPNVLDRILADGGPAAPPHPGLWVGNEAKDDAAVMDLGDGTGLISTTDFFMPIVDDPTDFGRIAATNAISDVYAMGGAPLMAIAILGWPIDQLAPEIAGQVVAGARAACAEAGIPLAGGHSIDAPEPIFGLAVSGRVTHDRLKRNSGAQPGAKLYLTKPLGIGILTTAEKKGRLDPSHQNRARDLMVQANRPGIDFAALPAVQAMTDVTGFGLLGHLLEVCSASGMGARLDADHVPRIPGLEDYVAAGCSPGGAGRNHGAYGDRVTPLPSPWREILWDPQTSGGLLVAVAPDGQAAFEATAREHGLELTPFGVIHEASGEPTIHIDPVHA